MNVQESHRVMKWAEKDSALKKMKMGENGSRDVEAQTEKCFIQHCLTKAYKKEKAMPKFSD